MKKLLFLLLLPVAFATGCVDLFGPASNPNPSAWRPQLPPETAGFEGASSSNRPLRPDDRVQVTIYAGVIDGTTRVDDVVNSDGFISLNMIGAIKLSGLNTTEAAESIRKAYIDGGFYTKLDVGVVCPDMLHQLFVSVTGSVRKIGEIPFRDGMTLREAIISAGDVTEFASGEVILYRNNVSTRYDLDRIKEGRDEDPVLRPRDIVEARRSRF